MSDWTLSASLLIPHDDRLLLLEGEEGWYLPSVAPESFLVKLHLVQREIQKRFGADMTLLRSVQDSYNEAEKSAQAWWLMENHTLDWTPPENSRWFGADEVLSLRLANADERSIVLEVLQNLDAPEPQLRPMFMKRGWFDEMRTWVSQTLEEQGYRLIRPPEQFKQYILTAILRVETDKGTLYAKVANPHYPLFCDEARTMQALAQIAPQHIPCPIAIHPEYGVGIFEDFGASLWEIEPSHEQRKKVVQSFANLQMLTATRLADLEQAGCLNRRLDMLKDAIDAVFSDGLVVAHVPDEKRDHWATCTETLKRLCVQLADYTVPHALVHGDFHGGNMTIDGERILFYDWTDACIAHPFFDIATIVEFDTEHADLWREAYLQCWQEFEPMERLREAFEIAHIVNAAHQLVTYHSLYIHSEDSYKKEFDWSFPRFVGVILEKLKVLDD